MSTTQYRRDLKIISELGPLVSEVPVQIGSRNIREIYELGSRFMNDSFHHFESLCMKWESKNKICYLDHLNEGFFLISDTLGPNWRENVILEPNSESPIHI